MTKKIKGDLILTKDTSFDESIEVEGNIKGYYNLKVEGNINAGIILVSIFGFLDLLMLIAVALYFSEWTMLGLGFTTGILFTQVVETFRDGKYDDRFHNSLRRED